MSDRSGLWALDKDPVTAEDATPELMEEHGGKFRPQFQQNHEEDVPTHPYKIYREIVENRKLSDDEKAVLKALKAEYAEKWLEQKRDEVRQR
ncbi:hypothetical protein [Natrinema sp. H-ect4]|uniref:hypothetical protein n=1 Tax=Natrinema sp. H-ect4 TaxID=3242699 RepID=UPI0035A9190E